ncbi:hypothetical protein HNR56_003809 [Roseospira marina]|nr:hypothetical protein [Roseospira marina]MBB5089094.1 hypothetical protein [Roseospira marina]
MPVGVRLACLLPLLRRAPASGAMDRWARRHCRSPHTKNPAPTVPGGA